MGFKCNTICIRWHRDAPQLFPRQNQKNIFELQEYIDHFEAKYSFKEKSILAYTVRCRSKSGIGVKYSKPMVAKDLLKVQRKHSNAI